MSAQVTLTPEKNNFGSGVYGRKGASLFFLSDAAIQLGVITGRRCSQAMWYWGKSEVDEIMCVTSAISTVPSAPSSDIVAPFSSSIALNCIACQKVST